MLPAETLSQLGSRRESDESAYSLYPDQPVLTSLVDVSGNRSGVGPPQPSQIVTIEQVRRIRWHLDIAHLMRLSGGKFRTFCECGVGPLDIAAAPKIYDENLSDKMILVEPNPHLADMARLRMPKAKLIQAAIGSQAGRAKFRMNMGSSYLANK